MSIHHLSNWRRRALALTALCIAAGAHAQSLSVTYTRVPTGTIEPNLEVRGGTIVRGINDLGQTVGSFGERNGTIWNLQHGFIHGSTDTGILFADDLYGARSPEGYRLGSIAGPRYADADYRYLDLAPAPASSAFNVRVTQPNAINNAGVVVGRLASDELDRGPSTAFRYDTTTRSLSLLAVPGASSSEATDINAAGDIVGNFTDATGDHGFLWHAGQYTVIDMPGEAGHTRLGGINDQGVIVGSAYDYGNPQSFVLRDGFFTTFTVQSLYTVASDINDSGQIVGWVGVSGQRRGFVWQGGNGTVLDLSAGTESTYVYTINNLGVMAGTVDGVGFLATVSSVLEPAPAALLGMGLLSMAGVRRMARRG